MIIGLLLLSLRNYECSCTLEDRTYSDVVLSQSLCCVSMFVLENGKVEAAIQDHIMITINSHDLSDNYDHEMMIFPPPPLLL